MLISESSYRPVRPIETLSALSRKTSPGRIPEFTTAHMLIALHIIRKNSPGRKQLSADLCLGEGTIRNLLRRLTEEDLVSSTRRGVCLTTEGKDLVNELTQRIRGRPVPRSQPTVGECNHVVLVKGGASKVRQGVTTTLIVEDGGFRAPVLPEAVENPIVESILELGPEEGDAVIIGTADHVFFAELGAYAAGLELLS